MKIRKSYDSKMAEGDLTAMIDMVFQLIIFFMVLINFSQDDQNDKIKLPSSELAKPPEAPFDRISLTLSALLASDRLMFVIRGEAKRAVFEAAVRGEHDLPVARLLGAASQPVTCFT